MKVNTLIMASLSAMLSSQAIAQSLWPIMETKNCSPFMTLSLGPTFTGGAESESFYLQPDVAKTYKVNRKVHAFGSGELFLGMQIPITPNFLSQVGVAVAGGLEAPLAGNIWEDQDPDFNNYTYKYKVNHGHLALKAKISTDTNTVVQPYVSGSIGVGVNKSHGFSISPIIYEEVPAPNFTSANDSGMVYTAGLGVQTSYNENWQVGLGYEFADWGNLELGRAPGQTRNTGLGANHLYTHELQFSITYVFVSRATRD